MKFFKNPLIAILLAVITVFASTLLSFEIRFGAKCQEVSDGFYDGVYYNGEMQPGCYGRLRTIVNYVKDYKSIALSCGASTDELESGIETMENALSYSSTDAGYLYYCYSELSTVLGNVRAELASLELSDDVKEQLSQILADIDVEEEGIENSGYNESVREFMREYEKFPVTALYWHTDVMYPSYYN